jgi:pyridoxal phosphate phosphatase PHOSPHO2
MSARKLVIWDFDWSLVNENSDTFIVKKFDECLAEHMKSELRKDFPVWTDLMVKIYVFS